MNKNLSNNNSKNKSFNSRAINDLLYVMNFFLKFINDKKLRKIFTNINILYNTIIYGQGRIYQQDKHIVNSQLIIMISSLNLLTNVLNSQFSFVASGKKKFKDIVSFYKLLFLKIEKQKMYKFNYMKREREKIEKFKSLLNQKLPDNNEIKKKLHEFKIIDQIKYEYFLIILYNLYKLIKGYKLTKKKPVEDENFRVNFQRLVFLDYSRFTKIFFPEDLKKILLNTHFKYIKDSNYLRYTPHLKKINKYNFNIDVFSKKFYDNLKLL